MVESKYIIGFDPCNKLSLFKKILKWVGLYKNKPDVTIFKVHNNKTLEHIK